MIYRLMKLLAPKEPRVYKMQGEFKEITNQKGATYVVTSYGIYMLKQEYVREHYNSPEELVHECQLVSVFGV